MSEFLDAASGVLISRHLVMKNPVLSSAGRCSAGGLAESQYSKHVNLLRFYCFKHGKGGPSWAGINLACLFWVRSRACATDGHILTEPLRPRAVPTPDLDPSPARAPRTPGLKGCQKHFLRNPLQFPSGLDVLPFLR